MTVECVKNATNAFLLHRDQRAANASTHTLLNALQSDKGYDTFNGENGSYLSHCVKSRYVRESRISLFVICGNFTIPCTLKLPLRFTLVDAEDN